MTDDATSAALPTPGTVVEGKYRIERVIGSGGMGVVVEAHHLSLDERVAIKFLKPDPAGGRERLARFAREAWAATKIKSGHVARVTDVSITPDGRCYMVMEYLEGEHLGALVTRRKLPVHEAVDYLLQAAEPLAEAHQLGIVHRDLKPENLFVTRRADGSAWIKVLDFGISKIQGPVALTTTAAILGSPLYMAPEQLASTKYVDARADVWSLGALLFKMITGETPFTGRSLAELCTSVLNDPPRKLRDLEPSAPVALEAAVERCLVKDPAARIASLAELAEALAPFGGPGAASSAAYVSRVLSRASIPAPERTPIDRSSAAPAPARAAVSHTEVLPVLARTQDDEEDKPTTFYRRDAPPPQAPPPAWPQPQLPRRGRASPTWAIVVASLLFLIIGGALAFLWQASGPRERPNEPLPASSAPLEREPAERPVLSTKPPSTSSAAATAPVAAPAPSTVPRGSRNPFLSR